MPDGKKLLFVVNVDWFFLSHRLPIAIAALHEGYEVHIASGITSRLAELQSYGFVVHPLSMRRGRAGLIADALSFVELLQLFRVVRPTIVHLVTIKPVLFGGIAARITSVPAVVAAISGLGFVFTHDGLRARLRRFAALVLYRLALGKRVLKVIVQNTSDRDRLAELAGGEKFVLIKGSGVDLLRFSPAPLPEGTPLVLMASRLIADKGVWDFIEAARLVKQREKTVRFVLVGQTDLDNPRSLTEADLENIRSEGVVELWGYKNDMPDVLAQSHLVAFPSYYGEGVPKALLEAAACGRAVVTTGLPGCRDAVSAESALLVPPHDPVALADAIGLLLANPRRCVEMGLAGRKLAEREFGLEGVVASHLKIYKELIQSSGGVGS